VSFAGIILITVGLFQAFAGLVGLIEDEFYAVTPEYVVQFDATTWGWIHIIIGLIVVAAGFGIFSGNVLARTVGVFAALGSMISVFAWLPWYPIWGIIVVSMNIAIIWALTVHGRVLADR
jgi:acyl-CoA synthetase (AMP-forming)/AMP-acid ligase II